MFAVLTAGWAAAQTLTDDVSDMDPEYYCTDRAANEFFRKDLGEPTEDGKLVRIHYVCTKLCNSKHF